MKDVYYSCLIAALLRKPEKPLVLPGCSSALYSTYARIANVHCIIITGERIAYVGVLVLGEFVDYPYIRLGYQGIPVLNFVGYQIEEVEYLKYLRLIYLRTLVFSLRSCALMPTG